MTISRTTIEGSGGSGSAGVKADGSTAKVQVSRLRSHGVPRPLVSSFGGSMTVRDSLLVLPVGVSATALEVGDQNNPANFTSKLAADRVTIIGDPAANQSGARTYANSAGDDFEVRIHDSILSGLAHPLICDFKAGKASATADWSSLPATGDGSGGGGCTVARTNPVAGTPIFVDAPGGDYHQRHDSPLVDAGDPAPLTAIDDLDGLSRPVGRTDLGAYEYQQRQPTNQGPNRAAQLCVRPHADHLPVRQVPAVPCQGPAPRDRGHRRMLRGVQLPDQPAARRPHRQAPAYLASRHERPAHDQPDRRRSADDPHQARPPGTHGASQRCERQAHRPGDRHGPSRKHQRVPHPQDHAAPLTKGGWPRHQPSRTEAPKQE